MPCFEFLCLCVWVCVCYSTWFWPTFHHRARRTRHQTQSPRVMCTNTHERRLLVLGGWEVVHNLSSQVRQRVLAHFCAGPCPKYKVITFFVPVDSRQTVPVHSMHTVLDHSRQTVSIHSRQIEPVRSTLQQADWACPQQADGFVFLALSSTYVRTW